jgi:ABC-type phosphate/phosphonate transport system substrate-binding protein
VVSTPVFDAPGCEGARYSSSIVVSASAHARGASSIEACRGLRAAYNDDDSNSGMNVFRHAVAPYQRDGRFFSSVTKTGSHLASLRLLAQGGADIAAIDCVTLAFARDAWPDLSHDIRVIGSTVTSPGLPLIASAAVDVPRVAELRDALDAAIQADPKRARSLRLLGFSRSSRRDYDEILKIENDAFALGYRILQ